jgi:uncharacterized protein YuzE
MKIRYYEDTDTLVIVLSEAPSTESTEIARNVVLDLDADNNVTAIEIEHASAFIKREALAAGNLPFQSVRKAV